MSDEQTTITTGDRKVSFAFERKITDNNYGHIMTRGWAETTVPAEASERDVYQAELDLGNAVKSAVLTSMGIEFTFDTDQGIVVEVAPVISIQQASAPAQAVQSGTSAPVTSGHGIRVANPNDQDGPLPDWLINACQRDGVTSVYDNRKTATGSRPLFKEAVGRGLQGHGKNGDPAAYWAPKS